MSTSPNHGLPEPTKGWVIVDEDGTQGDTYYPTRAAAEAEAEGGQTVQYAEDYE